MNERFFIYSLENKRKIKLLLMIDEKFSSINAFVVKNEPEFIEVIKSSKQKTPLRIAKESILSCSYARGDHGETL